MISFIVCLLILVCGYFTYGKFVDNTFGPDDRETPAVAINDGVDYVVMPAWKLFLVQLLNIAGLGPIFGAMQGALWGPIVFLWITFGTVFAGAVHDYFSGMLSERNDGASISEVTGIYLGPIMHTIMRVFAVILLIMVGTVFAVGPAGLLVKLLTEKGVYCARDALGRTPIHIGHKAEGYCACFESFAYEKLGYAPYMELGPGEIVIITPNSCNVLSDPGKKKKICTFLWTYYGYPPSRYEGTTVEKMRYDCGKYMAQRDYLTRDDIDIVAGVPDSGIAHAIGYSNESHVPYSRPFIKYTPTWPRSFMPTIQSKRDLIARMKLIPVAELIENKRMLLIDDSIVRGTQLRETTEFLYESGAKEVHVRPACPPILFGCKYINFSRSTNDMELIARRIIAREEGEDVERVILDDYANPDSDRYHKMLDLMKKEMNFSSLSFNRLDDTIRATGLSDDEVCTYCWNGKE